MTESVGKCYGICSDVTDKDVTNGALAWKSSYLVLDGPKQISISSFTVFYWV